MCATWAFPSTGYISDVEGLEGYIYFLLIVFSIPLLGSGPFLNLHTSFPFLFFVIILFLKSFEQISDVFVKSFFLVACLHFSISFFIGMWKCGLVSFSRLYCIISDSLHTIPLPIFCCLFLFLTVLPFPSLYFPFFAKVVFKWCSVYVFQTDSRLNCVAKLHVR